MSSSFAKFRRWLPRRRTLFASALSCVLLVGLFVQVGVSQPDTDVDVINCLDLKKFAPASSSEATLQLVCGGGFWTRGAVGGSHVRLPLAAVSHKARHNGGLTPRWGKLRGTTGERVRYTTKEVLKDLIRRQNIPMPRKDSKTARRHRTTPYNVYQIWWTPRSEGTTYKYGITRQKKVDGTCCSMARRRAGVRACNDYLQERWWMNASCQSGWIRTNVKGFYRARLWEAAYIARWAKLYRAAPANVWCPPGQNRSCR